MKMKPAGGKESKEACLDDAFGHGANLVPLIDQLLTLQHEYAHGCDAHEHE